MSATLSSTTPVPCAAGSVPFERLESEVPEPSCPSSAHADHESRLATTCVAVSSRLFAQARWHGMLRKTESQFGLQVHRKAVTHGGLTNVG